MLDRESELEVLRTAIATASTGLGSALVVEGIAGIGKTRLLTEGCALGQRAGLRILRAGCGEFDTGRHLQPSVLELPVRERLLLLRRRRHGRRVRDI